MKLHWSRNERGDLDIEWREIGGPEVRKPTRQGFGTTIIERSVPYDLGGEAEVRYEPSGFEADFRIPARHVSGPRVSGPTTISSPRSSHVHPEEVPTDLLKGQEVLLVEDSLIIALDAEDSLMRLGSDAVATAASVDAAMELIASSAPTIAILDINLGGTTSFPIADELLERGIPFIFATGYGEQASFPNQHRGRSVIQKPYTLENVARALAGVLR